MIDSNFMKWCGDETTSEEVNVALCKFIENCTHKYIEKIERYGAYFLKEKCFEPAFLYGERQSSSFLVPVIDELCQSIFIQENEIERRIYKEKNKIEIKKVDGRIDFWCSYRHIENVTILLELKQSWINYIGETKFKNIEVGVNKHFEAIIQINNVEEKSWYNMDRKDDMFGIALSIIPIFTKYKDKRNRIIKYNYDAYDSLAKKIKDSLYEKWGKSKYKKDVNLNQWYLFTYGHVFPKKLGEEPVVFEKGVERYPGIVFCWSVLKIE